MTVRHAISGRVEACDGRIEGYLSAQRLYFNAGVLLFKPEAYSRTGLGFRVHQLP